MSGLLKRWFFALLFLAVFIALLVGFSPLLVEHFVLPPLLAKSGLEDYRISISRLGLNGCSMHISGGPHLTSPIVSGDLRIDWTPSGLYLGRIDRLTSNGLHINLANLPKRKLSSDKQTNLGEKSNKGSKQSIFVEQVDVRNGSLLVVIKDRIVYLPFAFSGQRTDEQDLSDPTGAIYYEIRSIVAENEINTNIALNAAEGKLSSQLEADFDLEKLAEISSIASFTPGKMGGNARLSVDSVIHFAPFAVERLQAMVVSRDLDVRAGKYRFTSSDREGSSARIIVSGAGTEYQIHGSGFHAAGPVTSTMELASEISYVQNAFQWKGTFDAAPLPVSLFQDRMRLLLDMKPLRISFAGSGNAREGSVHLKSEIPAATAGQSSLILHYNDTLSNIKDLGLDANLAWGQPQGKGVPGMTLLLEGRNSSVTLSQGKTTMASMSLHVDAAGLPGQKDFRLKGRLGLHDASFAHKDEGFLLDGIQLELPFAWPLADTKEKGALKLKTISLGGNKLGSVTADVTQAGESVSITGGFSSLLLPEKKVSFHGSMKIPEEKNSFAEFAFSLDDAFVTVNDLARFFPAMQGMTGGGKVTLLGDLAISECGLSGQAEFSLRDGRLVFKNAGAEFEDIQLHLHFPSLPLIRSKPRQQLAIGKIKKNNLVIENLKTWFGIESTKSLFIEEISGSWSKGRLFTSSFRLQRGQDELDIALFCDRLELSSILTQFNFAEAGGEGRMSGRIPLHYSKGSFFVDDGFLFSTPGEQGYLKIRQSKYLDTTIPADVPHFSPLHFAGAALADFEYNWAKLQIKSVEENLLMKLQVDGKPREKMPFRFDTGRNVFVRLEDSSRGGIDQPVKLDVNFNVPLNELLQYKKTIIPLFRKFK